ncbi:glutathionylspermidine synthase family protein [Ammoniphilus sp. YIM 78166]|uniref:glutathionylspermidine synthase family protein n=1 Tax=Ammoniphilus sp. YIM 78166 TaxID=1644106 RepID=UPI00106F896A|nr:glutathionylspermidine synthase family protein [Ammoniphilus sp. YIM 78166]
MRKVYSLPVNHDGLFSEELGERIPYHRMYGKEYCVPAVTAFSEKEMLLLKEASEKIDRIYRKVLRFVQRFLPDPVLVNQLGIHPALIPAARLEVPFHGVSRQDWIMQPDGIKMIENNTDTPTGIPETAYLAGAMVKRFTKMQNPSEGMDRQIRESFSSLIQFYRQCGFSGEIAFSCYDWHEEDLCNTTYLMEQVQKEGFPAFFVPLEKLEVKPNVGLFYEGKRIDIWYRLYPLEYLVYDTDDDGCETGLAILELISQKKLAIINPVQSIITQSKGFMALIWSLYEKNDHLQTLWNLNAPIFTKEECEAISRHLLPTYFEDTFFRQDRIPWVSKSLFGREGKGTVLFDKEGLEHEVKWEHQVDDEEDQATREYYSNQPRIYQQRISQERITIPTETGSFDGYLLVGSFVMGGVFAGILPRVGGVVTGNLAYFIPAGMEKEGFTK